MTGIAIYIAKLPKEACELHISDIFPPDRAKEISKCKHENTRREKYFVWKLLEYAVMDSVNLDMHELAPQKNANGKWESKELFFSLSHRSGAVAVALSSSAVGVDLENVEKIKPQIAKKVLSEKELCEISNLSPYEQKKYVAEKWTQKESEFKRIGGELFWATSIYPTCAKTVFTEIGGKEFALSVSGDGEITIRENINL